MESLKDLIPEKLNSDRLWALVAYAALLVLNAKLQLGVPPEQMTELLYAVIAFVVGKSIRGTTAGSFVSALMPKLTEAAASIEPAPAANAVPPQMRDIVRGMVAQSISEMTTPTTEKVSYDFKWPEDELRLKAMADGMPPAEIERMLELRRQWWAKQGPQLEPVEAPWDGEPPSPGK